MGGWCVATEKAFKTALRKLGWHMYRDGETKRLVTNCYRREIAGLSKKLGLPLEVVAENGSMVKAAAVECTAIGH